MDKDNLSEVELVYKEKKYRRIIDKKGIRIWYSPE